MERPKPIWLAEVNNVATNLGIRMRWERVVVGDDRETNPGSQGTLQVVEMLMEPGVSVSCSYVLARLIQSFSHIIIIIIIIIINNNQFEYNGFYYA